MHISRSKSGSCNNHIKLKESIAINTWMCVWISDDFTYLLPRANTLEVSVTDHRDNWALCTFQTFCLHLTLLLLTVYHTIYLHETPHRCSKYQPMQCRCSRGKVLTSLLSPNLCSQTLQSVLLYITQQPFAHKQQDVTVQYRHYIWACACLPLFCFVINLAWC